MWPDLPLADWQETYDTLHLWTQIVGKISLKLNPLINHWWECSLKVNARGLTTGLMAYKTFAFEIRFDFVDHFLVIETSKGDVKKMLLKAFSVADFYFELMALLKSLDITVTIDTLPQEIPNPIPCDEDKLHCSYDRAFANKHWQILVETHKILTKFRSHFLGKASPVQFFWGSFDLTVSLFSGRLAPPRPGADHITQEGYSHEDFACGFWPGGGAIKGPAFYAYIAPEPAGFSNTTIDIKGASYNQGTKGFLILYDDIKKFPSPEQTLLDFFNQAYNSAADLARWDRLLLERQVKV